MENFQVYRDIQARTGGDIYIGVVGPVQDRKIHVYPKVYGAYSSRTDVGETAG